MDKPTPKWELVVHDCLTELHLHPETNDAVEWVREEAPAYGYLDHTLFDTFGYYVLHLRPNFDSGEVARYLASMGSDNREGCVQLRGRQVYPAVILLEPTDDHE